mgnify:CR=1 FL=1
MSEIAEKVTAIIVDKLGVNETEVKPEATFAQDLGADSLDTLIVGSFVILAPGIISSTEKSSAISSAVLGCISGR